MGGYDYMNLAKGLHVSAAGLTLALLVMGLSFVAKPVHANVLCNVGTSCTYYSGGSGFLGTCATYSAYCACQFQDAYQQQSACNAQL